MDFWVVFRALLTVLAESILEVEVWAVFWAADTEGVIEIRCVFGAVSDRGVLLDSPVIDSLPLVFRLSTINEIRGSFNISLIVVVRLNARVHVVVENAIAAARGALHPIKRKEALVRAFNTIFFIEKWSFDGALLSSLHF